MYGCANNKPFDPHEVKSRVDYSEESSWVALPSKLDYSDWVLEKKKDQNTPERKVDVFYIHPTGYYSQDSWVDPLNKDSKSNHNTQVMMINQASAFNQCCLVYAPYYRQASMAVFSKRTPEDTKYQVLNFSYQDVKRAFNYYIKHYNKNRPFIIASHSQGAMHAARLIKEVIDTTSLYNQLVAAYIIGSGFSEEMASDLQNIKVCKEPSQTGCLVHWATYNERYMKRKLSQNDKRLKSWEKNNVCVNPIHWRTDETRSTLAESKGVLDPILDTKPIDEFQGNTMKSKPLRNFLQAKCKNGLLFVTDLKNIPLETIGKHFFYKRGSNYHMLDFNLFYMDIRENSRLRSTAYFQFPKLSPTASRKKE